MLNKPYIFIGCSKEGQQIANMLQVLLQEDTYSFLENQCIGEPMYNRLELINSHLEKSDFGVIVFTKSDIEQNNNDILFLLGLLKGELGKDRFMVLLPKDMSTSVITSYLKGAEPGRYDDEHPDLGGSLGTTAFAIKEALKKMEKRKTEAYYFQLESKKELLKEALDSYNCSKDRYNPFLSSLMGYFNTEIDQFSFPQVLGATLFAYQKDELVQVGSSGKVKSDHRISLAEEDKFVVQCYKQKTMVLGEKKIGTMMRMRSHSSIYFVMLFIKRLC